jgi:hypothetical protein
MIYAVRRNISNIKELEYIERKKAETETIRLSFIRPSSANSNSLSEDFVSDWNELYNYVPFDSFILIDFGFVDETP